MILRDKHEIFSYVKKKLLEQGCRSVGLNGSCAYRGDNNRKCAVGHLIDDEHYTQSLENLPADSPAVRYAVAQSIRPGGYLYSEEVDLLQSLQYMHDGRRPITWPDNLQNIAEEYHINEVPIE